MNGSIQATALVRSRGFACWLTGVPLVEGGGVGVAPAVEGGGVGVAFAVEGGGVGVAPAVEGGGVGVASVNNKHQRRIRKQSCQTVITGFFLA